MITRNVPLNDNEAKHLLSLLGILCEQLSNNGCNDFPVENTDANWELKEKLCGDDVRISPGRRPPLDQKIWLHDTALVHYFEDKIEDAFQDVEGWGGFSDDS